MANTNGMRHPVTAKKDMEFDGRQIVAGRVFDALTRDTAKSLHAGGWVHIGDTTEGNHAVQVDEEGLVNLEGRVGEPGSSKKSANNVDQSGTEIAHGGNGSFGSLAPQVPELNKTEEDANAGAAAGLGTDRLTVKQEGEGAAIGSDGPRVDTPTSEEAKDAQAQASGDTSRMTQDMADKAPEAGKEDAKADAKKADAKADKDDAKSGTSTTVRRTRT